MNRPCLFKYLLLLSMAMQAERVLAISSAECREEQLAFIEASMDDASPSRRAGSAIAPYIVASMLRQGGMANERADVRALQEEQRGYGRKEAEKKILDNFSGANQVRNLDNAKGANESIRRILQRQEMELESYRSNPWRGRALGSGEQRLPPEPVVRSVAQSRLQLCISNLLVQELSGVRPAAQSQPASQDCSAQNTEAANRAMSDADSQLQAYFDSPLSRHTGAITPGLQLVMWATSAQAKIIRQYCPDGAGFKEQLASLDAAFKTAQANCRTIQRNPENCVPAAPQELIASYEKAQREVAAAAHRAAQSRSSSGSSDTTAPSSTKPPANDTACGPGGRGVCWAR